MYQLSQNNLIQKVIFSIKAKVSNVDIILKDFILVSRVICMPNKKSQC